MGDVTLSLVVPIHSEEAVIPEFYGRTKRVVASLTPPMKHELIFVNDGSTDNSLMRLRDLAQRDPCVKIIDLSRNFGHQIAITAGIDHASGDAVVVIDGDLQDPPEVLVEMIAKWREGFQVIYGVRKNRRGEGNFKLLTAKLFYRLLAGLSDVKIPLDTGDFRLMDRVVVQALSQVREQTRFIRGLVSWVGFKQIALPYERDARFAGVTKFHFTRMLRFALDGLSSFSDKPLRLSANFGLMVMGLSVLYGIWLILSKLIAPSNSIPGWTTVMVAVLFLGGAQLLAMGILGEYVARIFRETKGRPLYFVSERVNFHTSENPAQSVDPMSVSLQK